jgi:hypothetical protein
MHLSTTRGGGGGRVEGYKPTLDYREIRTGVLHKGEMKGRDNDGEADGRMEMGIV